MGIILSVFAQRVLSVGGKERVVEGEKSKRRGANKEQGIGVKTTTQPFCPAQHLTRSHFRAELLLFLECTKDKKYPRKLLTILSHR